ncbi:MAG: hypothetical protein JWO13_800 [Acidobacteriales bacterium]|nr:hypothetical protein [Terriglobales bacterium]
MAPTMEEIRIYRKDCLRNQQVWPRGVKPAISPGLRRLLVVILAVYAVIGWQVWQHFHQVK